MRITELEEWERDTILIHAELARSCLRRAAKADKEGARKLEHEAGQHMEAIESLVYQVV